MSSASVGGDCSSTACCSRRRYMASEGVAKSPVMTCMRHDRSQLCSTGTAIGTAFARLSLKPTGRQEAAFWTGDLAAEPDAGAAAGNLSPGARSRIGLASHPASRPAPAEPPTSSSQPAAPAPTAPAAAAGNHPVGAQADQWSAPTISTHSCHRPQPGRAAACCQPQLGSSAASRRPTCRCRCGPTCPNPTRCSRMQVARQAHSACRPVRQRPGLARGCCRSPPSLAPGRPPTRPLE